jgi:hypothetical protein
LKNYETQSSINIMLNNEIEKKHKLEKEKEKEKEKHYSSE